MPARDARRLAVPPGLLDADQKADGGSQCQALKFNQDHRLVPGCAAKMHHEDGDQDHRDEHDKDAERRSHA